MDSLDTKIISVLQEDGTETNAGIARKVGVSEETIRRRIKALKDGKYLQVVAIADPEKMGFECQVLIGIKASPRIIDHVADNVANLEEIGRVVVTTGSFDIFAWATLKKVDLLHQFISQSIGTIEGVESIETFVNISNVKNDFSLHLGS